MKIVDLNSQLEELNKFVAELSTKEIVMWLSESGELNLIQENLPDGGSLYKFTSPQNIEAFVAIQNGNISIFDTKI